MRIKIKHETHYLLEDAARRAMQYLRLTPRSDRNQMIVDWKIDGPEQLVEWRDGFGNIVHYATENTEHHELTITVEGEVQTVDTAGVLPLDDGLPPGMFLRKTPLTRLDTRLDRFARKFTKSRKANGEVPFLHEMMNALADEVDYEKGHSTVDCDAATVFKNKKGVCQDFAHIFIALCRVHDIPSRYVSGYITHGSGEAASHGWAESYVQDLGWVSFDPANRQSATESYVHLAVGYDYDSVAPVIGVRTGGEIEKMSVNVQVQQLQS